jgi:hypothetical protein
MPATRPAPIVCPEALIGCLSQLREARALILRDAESFHEAATVLEHVGQITAGTMLPGLEKYERDLRGLATLLEGTSDDEIARLLRVVREARNMAVHEGAWARHLSTRLIDLFLVLEEAVITKMSDLKPTLLVTDVMVRGPLIAESWQPVSFARRAMLANSFSTLPIFSEGAWRFVTDTGLLRYLSGSTGPARRERLGASIGGAVADGKLALADAKCTGPLTTTEEARRIIEHLPLLVTETLGDQVRLVGILTAFDLL